ncbi:MAG: alpha/beta hydrolase [Clostridium sp.]|nr:alpha/beta hydrolase [Clostridium sp.]
MKRITFLSLLLAAALGAAAAEPVVLPLWPDGMPNDNGLTAADEQTQPGWIMSVAVPELTVYPADKPTGMAIVACPGGGYAGVAIDNEGHNFSGWMNDRGITYAVLRYRMPNKGHYDVPLSDAEQAMKIMCEHAEQWGLDPDNIGIMGSSAGGHLASTLATHYSSPETRPAFQILLYPVITMGRPTHGGSRENLLGENPSPELISLFSNDQQVTSETPRAFIAVTSDDTVVPLVNSLCYTEALADHGVPVSLHVYPRGNHGFGFQDAFPYKALWLEELDNWLKP